jgi:hypothetical protein
MKPIPIKYRFKMIRWNKNNDVDFPFFKMIKGVEWKIRLNGWPDEPLFSLFINGEHIGDIEDWPTFWSKP